MGADTDILPGGEVVEEEEGEEEEGPTLVAEEGMAVADMAEVIDEARRRVGMDIRPRRTLAGRIMEEVADMVVIVVVRNFMIISLRS